MAEFFRKKLLPFLISFLSCGLIYTVVALVCILPSSQTLSAQQNLNDQPYYSAKADSLKCNILVTLSDTPYCFFISLNSENSQCEILFFTTSCVKNSSTEFDVTNIKHSAEAFFGLTTDRFITLNANSFSDFIDLVGGVTLQTPYGLTSPANKEKYIAADEELHFFGDTALEIMLFENKPDTERLTYYAKITALACSAALKDFKSEAFEFIINNCKTDISYIDFYDNEENLSLCTENIKHSAPNGTWINHKYYLQ